MRMNIYVFRDASLSDTDMRKKISDQIKRYAIKREFGIADFEISLGENGKPHVAGREDIFFSVSHSGDAIVCAACGFPIGVDIERHRNVNEPLKSLVIPKTAKGDDRTFFDAWTMREAWIKARGDGINKSTLIQAPVFADDEMKLFYKSDAVSGGNIEICSGYSFAYCALAREIKKPNIVFLNNLEEN